MRTSILNSLLSFASLWVGCLLLMMGILRFLPESDAAQWIHDTQTALVAIYIASFLGWLLVGWWWALRLTRDLQQFQIDVEAIGRGHLDHRIAPDGISELNDLAQSLNQMAGHVTDLNAQANSAARAKTEFLANISHEVRTPMNGVLGMVELLQGTPMDHEQQEYLETLRRSALSLMEMLDDVLDFATVSEGQIKLNPRPFDLQLLLEDVMALLAPRTQGRELELVLRLCPEAPRFLIGDPSRLRQVLVALLGNALKFTGEGFVLLAVECELLEGDHAMLRLDISDSGRGIAAEELEKIFQRFTQADGSSTRNAGGVGLGLALVNAIVRRMSGEITVASNEGKGTTFSMRIPLELDEGPAVSGPVQVRKPDGQPLRALTVGPGTLSHFVMREQLEAAGVECDGVREAQRAFEALREAANQGRPFSLVILDSSVKGIQPSELTRAFNAEPVALDTCFVLLTDFESLGESEQLARQWDMPLLMKPARPSQLGQLMRALAEGRRPRLSSARPSTRSLPSDGSFLSLEGIAFALVEDNRINRERLVRMLTGRGAQVRAFVDGEAFLEAHEHGARWDCVLLDSDLPGMDGLGVSDRVRRREIGERSRLILMQVTASAAQKELALARELDGLLAKPVEELELDQILRQLRVTAATATTTV